MMRPHAETEAARTQRSDRPLLAVIVPTYNRADIVQGCLRSVLAQEFDDFEVVVVNDGSTDATRDVLARVHHPRLRVVHQENAGLSTARNVGVEHASATYVTFLDDDDRVDRRWLSGFANAISAEQASIVCCGAHLVDEDDVVVSTRRPRRLSAPFDHVTGLFLAGTFAMRRDIFQEVGGFAPELPSRHTTDFLFRLLGRSRERGWTVSSVPDPLVQITRPGKRRRDGQWVPRRLGELPDRRYQGILRIIEQYGGMLESNPGRMASYLAVAAVAAARSGDLPSARRCLFRAIRVQPHAVMNYARLALALVPPAARRVWGTT